MARLISGRGRGAATNGRCFALLMLRIRDSGFTDSLICSKGPSYSAAFSAGISTPKSMMNYASRPVCQILPIDPGLDYI